MPDHQGHGRYLILDGSESYDRAAFEYPSGVVVRPTGRVIDRRGLELRELALEEGEIRTLDGRVADHLYFRPRHVGGEIHSDSIVVYVDVGAMEANLGWFNVEPI
ncbi:hypothetical protein ACO2Q1_06165 [Brevundimonas sp. VNH65]|uniref:hypothetical protein n=1 Tax=Brevundimonas sp. VNH65 TaxID=3400917 RepID=UPI003C0F3715